MPRKPNYDFEKKERERLKSEKKAARAKDKIEPVKTEADEQNQDMIEQPLDHKLPG